MVTYRKFNQFVKDLTDGKHNLAVDELKIMLTNTAPLASNSVKADITEISAGNGYSAGGAVAALVSSAQVAGAYKLVLSNVVFTANSGSIGPFRYAVIYNNTQTSPAKPLIGWFDYGSSTTLLAAESFTVTIDQVNGILKLQ